MAVAQRVDVAYRKFSGWQEPQFPSGYHLTEGAMIGDATGGDQVLLFDFSRSTEQRNSQYYSIEEIRIAKFEPTADNIELEIVNFDSAITTRMHLELVNTQSGFGSLSARDVAAIRGIFLGQQSSPTGNTSVSITMDNTDTILVRMLLGGYVWSARSTAVPGGPQRPLTGLYRP